MFKKIHLIILSLCLLSFLSLSPVSAVNLDKITNKNTVSLSSQLDQKVGQDFFQIELSAKSLKGKTEISLENLGSAFDWPWNYSPLSSVYQFDFSDKGINYDHSQPLEISISYAETNDYYKQIFFYDGGQKKWRPLPSVDDPVNKTVRANIHLPYARVALLYNDQVMTMGQASWYRFKNGLFAASPDFAKGTILKVTNLDNNKAVEVVVNDYGPDRSLHPERVIDLDAVAFNKIASTRDGLVKVGVEVVKLVSKEDLEKLEAVSAIPNISASSAVVISATDGKVLYAKKADFVAPLASLTKLLSMKVFLDTKPDLNRVIAYSDQDAEFNYQYVKPWESARLRISNGETATLENLLYASLVGSANNTTETLVRASGLSRVEFIRRMNEQVRSWGAVNTKFIEPTGLSPDNVSSPLDYAIIVRELLKDELLKKISTTLRYSFVSINQNKNYTLNNTNSLLKSGDFNINVSKTGYLDEAGYCLMTQVDSKNGPLIVVTFNSSSRTNSFQDNEKLIKYGLKKLEK